MTTTQNKTLRHVGLTRERVEQMTAKYKGTVTIDPGDYGKSDKCVFPESVKKEIRRLKAAGFKYDAIANIVGCSKTSVYNVLNEEKR